MPFRIIYYLNVYFFKKKNTMFSINWGFSIKFIRKQAKQGQSLDLINWVIILTASFDVASIPSISKFFDFFSIFILFLNKIPHIQSKAYI